MCLVTMQEKAKTLRKDLTLYKALYVDPTPQTIVFDDIPPAVIEPQLFYSVYYGFQYRAGDTYTEPNMRAFTYMEGKKRDLSICPFDSYDSDAVFARVHTLRDDKLRFVVFGFHCATTKERLKEEVLIQPYERARVLVQCTAPKGSSIFYGFRGLVAVNQIRIDGIVTL